MVGEGWEHAATIEQQYGGGDDDKGKEEHKRHVSFHLYI
jgi:hypothetical protein